ncbi:hypothetical protein 31B4_036 [Streptococcus phage 31B4]|nr:hypothetical protein 31B4_036 [Streptococcus phage 31B4]
MQYKVITYFDNMEDDVEIYDSKDEAINRVHHLRGVKYRNSRLYTVEMKEEAPSKPVEPYKVNLALTFHGGENQWHQFAKLLEDNFVNYVILK